MLGAFLRGNDVKSADTATFGWTVPSYAAIALFFGVSVETVKRWAAAGMPRHRPYDLARIVAWLRSEGPWRPGAERPQRARVDDIGARALARCRQNKAIMLDLEVQERIGSVVRRDAIRTDLGRFSALIRRAAEKLASKFGDEAAAIVIRAIDQAERITDRLAGGNESRPKHRPARQQSRRRLG
jgi:hypothetical protein